ncbi:hypothetical protein PRUPE_8G100200 [Prunus persica]|uniref:DUF7086 domain-containing protein n=1 Tax=Prunus persica TaxID=3760 RepID=A0A251MVY3_PRUPE|nr:pistil-specific extensin-like protein [Prunus persica]ONH91226.1 hypothetical protein PRUPE_8G100200 [Prunus persica]
MNNNDQGINNKRKNNNQDLNQPMLSEEDEDDMLALSLSPYRPSRPRRSPDPVDPPPPPPSLMPSLFMQTLTAQNPPPQPLQLSPSHPLYMTTQQPPSLIPSSMPLVYSQEPGRGPSTSRPIRTRRNPTQVPREGKSKTVPAPFPWATTRRATVHTLEYLLSRGIRTITGDVQCKRCEKSFVVEYDLEEKFTDVGSFVAENKNTLRDRAPRSWTTPVLPRCRHCQEESSGKPIIAEKKKAINWLFLLLGQMLGCCTLEQLKYFCKHTKNHRTGAKDRVLFLTYLELCKQLDPNGPFYRSNSKR